MRPSFAEAMSQAAFSINQAARRKVTGTARLPSASSIRRRTLRRFGCGESAPMVDKATTFCGLARASESSPLRLPRT